MTKIVHRALKTFLMLSNCLRHARTKMPVFSDTSSKSFLSLELSLRPRISRQKTASKEWYDSITRFFIAESKSWSGRVLSWEYKAVSRVENNLQLLWKCHKIWKGTIFWLIWILWKHEAQIPLHATQEENKGNLSKCVVVTIYVCGSAV